MNISYLIKRETGIFNDDISNKNDQLKKKLSHQDFDFSGGFNRQAVVREIFKRGPKKLHVVDINENHSQNLLEIFEVLLGHIEVIFRFLFWTGSDEYNLFTKLSVP